MTATMNPRVHAALERQAAITASKLKTEEAIIYDWLLDASGQIVWAAKDRSGKEHIIGTPEYTVLIHDERSPVEPYRLTDDTKKRAVLTYHPYSKWIREQAHVKAQNANVELYGAKRAERLPVNTAVLQKEMTRLMVIDCTGEHPLQGDFDAWYDSLDDDLGNEVSKVLFAPILKAEEERARAKNS